MWTVCHVQSTSYCLLYFLQPRLNGVQSDLLEYTSYQMRLSPVITPISSPKHLEAIDLKHQWCAQTPTAPVPKKLYRIRPCALDTTTPPASPILATTSQCPFHPPPTTLSIQNGRRAAKICSHQGTARTLARVINIPNGVRLVNLSIALASARFPRSYNYGIARVGIIRRPVAVDVSAVWFPWISRRGDPRSAPASA